MKQIFSFVALIILSAFVFVGFVPNSASAGRLPGQSLQLGTRRYEGTGGGGDAAQRLDRCLRHERGERSPGRDGA